MSVRMRIKRQSRSEARRTHDPTGPTLLFILEVFDDLYSMPIDHSASHSFLRFSLLSLSLVARVHTPPSPGR